MTTLSIGNTPTKLMVLSDASRIISMVMSGSKVVVQAMVSPRPLMDALVNAICGKSAAEYLKQHITYDAALKDCLQRLRANSGDMELANPEVLPGEILRQYLAKHEGAFPDAYVIFVDTTALTKVLEQSPESIDFVMKFMDDTERSAQEGTPEHNLWSKATHAAPETKQ